MADLDNTINNPQDNPQDNPIKEIPEVISNEAEEKVIHEEKLSKKEKLDLIDNLTKEMKLAAANLDFERAMSLRDIIFDIESK